MSKLTLIEKVQFARKVLSFLKFTKVSTQNQAAWSLVAQKVDDREVWTCPFETVLGRVEDPKKRKQIDITGMHGIHPLHGKQIAVVLTIRGYKSGDWQFYFKNYSKELKDSIYNAARKIEEERNLA